MKSSSRISIDDISAQFRELLRANQTSFEAPKFAATWRAFAAFAQFDVECDDESLFFEYGLSPSNEDRFYVNFTRTFFGRDAGNHFWSSEVNCDFIFQTDDILEELGETVEADDLAGQPGERAAFIEQVEAQAVLWRALQGRESLAAAIYVGES